METPDAPSNDKPFDDEPFDAGVEADEDSDPKKFIQQLSGKLGQSLRKYEEEQGGPDFELEKFAINSVLSATHTAEMDPEDQKDIIKKVKSSGRGDADVSSDDEMSNDEPQDLPADNEELPDENNQNSDDEDNLFEVDTITEMSLNDWRAKAILKLYDTGDQQMKQLLTKLVSYTDKINRSEFIKDLMEGGIDDVKYVFKELESMNIDIPVDDHGLSEAQIFLSNPPKNNMFQEGSNDILNEKKPCWKGYKQIGMKTKDGKEVPNCVPIDEETLNEKKPCWKGYKQIGMKTKNGKEVPNCVPIDENISKLHNKLIKKLK